MMPRIPSTIGTAAAALCVLLASLPSGFAQLLAPDQLENLVAPVALYPDPLLAQVMAASTYPLEIVEAQQWFQQNGNLQGVQLMDAARQQNWDPSVQALAAFPDVLRLLASDVRWTTDLGNAFLSQQADVMAAVQRMRARAQASGTLQSTPQQMVTTGTQDGQSAIEIQPASPQVMYVPVYQPEYVWGPPAFGAYPATWYPAGSGSGFGFDPGVILSALFQGFTGWGGWGWVLNWLGHGLFGSGLFGHGSYGNGLLVNAGFFNRYGFSGGFANAAGGGLGVWQHNPSHRMGVQYPNQVVASRFNRSYGGQFNGARYASPYATQSGWRGFNGGSNRMATGSFDDSYRQAGRGYQTPAQSFRGFNSTPGRGSAPSYDSSRMQNYSSARSYSAPRQSFSASRSFSMPHAMPHSGPHFSGAGSHGSAGHSGGGGGHSREGGGHSGGGRHKR